MRIGTSPWGMIPSARVNTRASHMFAAGSNALTPFEAHDLRRFRAVCKTIPEFSRGNLIERAGFIRRGEPDKAAGQPDNHVQQPE